MTNTRRSALRKPALMKIYSSALILMDYSHLLGFINKQSFCQALCRSPGWCLPHSSL